MRTYTFPRGREGLENEINSFVALTKTEKNWNLEIHRVFHNLKETVIEATHVLLVNTSNVTYEPFYLLMISISRNLKQRFVIRA